MATISEMLLGMDRGIPKGDLEPARKLVEEYKKLIDEYPHKRLVYEIGDMIGYCDYTPCGGEHNMFMSFHGEKVYYDYRLVNEEQLNYCLRKEGLRAEMMRSGRYEGCICIFIS